MWIINRRRLPGTHPSPNHEGGQDGPGGDASSHDGDGIDDDGHNQHALEEVVVVVPLLLQLRVQQCQFRLRLHSPRQCPRQSTRPCRRRLHVPPPQPLLPLRQTRGLVRGHHNLTTATTSTSRDDDKEEEEEDSRSFSGLLRQLSHLERNVIVWNCRRRTPSGWAQLGETGEERRAQRRSHATPGGTGGGEHRRRQKQRLHNGGGASGKMRDSVVVVTETEDPLGEFRRSMLQMIVENDIVCPEELRELLDRFLALNSPSHHALVVRAFADILRDVFSGYLEDVLELLVTAPSRRRRRRGRFQHLCSYYGHDYY